MRPVNRRKIVDILLKECGTVPERGKSYREELTWAVADILTEERAHRVSRTRIQKFIDDKVRATARLLGDDSETSNEA